MATQRYRYWMLALLMAACRPASVERQTPIADHRTPVDFVAAADTVRADTVAAVPAASDSSRGDRIVAFAQQYLGTPYVSAGCSKDGFDCSGFVYFVYKHFGIQVPRSSIEFGHFGREVPVDSARNGDIVVFLSPTRPVIGHVGIIYRAQGMQSDFIHASSGSEMQVIVTNLTKAQYTKRFVKVVRVE